MGKVVIKILQGSAVTQTMLSGLAIYPPVANFLQCICARNYENWQQQTKLLLKLSGLLFWPTLYISLLVFELLHICSVDVLFDGHYES